MSLTEKKKIELTKYFEKVDGSAQKEVDLILESKSIEDINFLTDKYKRMSELLAETVEFDIKDTSGERHSIRLCYSDDL